MKSRNLLALVVSTLLVAGFGPCNPNHDIDVVNLNLLHGFDCDPPTPGDGDQCRVAERVDLLRDHIVDSGCPDIVTLQENVVNEFVQTSATEIKGPLQSTLALIKARLPSLTDACGFEYHVIFDPDGATPGGAPRGIDEELILTRYPARDARVGTLYSALVPFAGRQVLYARIDHPIGPVDVFTTHLASGADAGSAPCGATIIQPVACPTECVAFKDSVRECQAKQVAQFVVATRRGRAVAFITGDFNAEPGSNVYDEFASRGWIDSHLAAGNGECDPATGENCTSGRSEVGGDLEDPALNVDERIDYIFVVPPEEPFRCSGEVARNSNPRVVITSAGLFASEPNPFAANCGAEPDAICWTSDHTGNAVNLSCRAGGRDRLKTEAE